MLLELLLQVLAATREPHHAHARIALVGVALDQAARLHAIDDAAHRGPVAKRGIGQIALTARVALA